MARDQTFKLFVDLLENTVLCEGINNNNNNMFNCKWAVAQWQWL
jgi:hypothetical protein